MIAADYRDHTLVPTPNSSFNVADLYSNEEIYCTLGLGNTGGIRVKTNTENAVQRIAIFSSTPSARQLAENPYADRIEGSVLVYTGAGKEGDQIISGPNARIIQQQETPFPIYGFLQVASRRDRSVGSKRWRFIGLLAFIRGYREVQIDVTGQLRKVWIFEFEVNSEPRIVDPIEDRKIAAEIAIKQTSAEVVDQSEVVSHSLSIAGEVAPEVVEPVRKRLLAYDPRQFELVICDLLRQSGFAKVEVTRFSQDGGIDINARPHDRSWAIRNLLVQIQAKRWLHTVGRKEVAELRGSLEPHAHGCIVTTSHFSRAALVESSAVGKVPIMVIDGTELSQIIVMNGLTLPS